MGGTMDFREGLFVKYGGRHSRRHHEHGSPSARPNRGESHGDPGYAPASEHPYGEHHSYRGEHGGLSTLPGVLRALVQRKALLVVAAVLLLVVTIGGVVGLALLLPLVGTLSSLVGAHDLPALLADLPKLLITFLEETLKAVLDYLASLLPLKDALEGKA